MTTNMANLMEIIQFSPMFRYTLKVADKVAAPTTTATSNYEEIYVLLYDQIPDSPGVLSTSGSGLGKTPSVGICSR